MMTDRSRYMLFSELEKQFNVRPERCPFCASPDVGCYLGPLPHMSCFSCGADGPPSEKPHNQDPVYRALLRWNQRPSVLLSILRGK